MADSGAMNDDEALYQQDRSLRAAPWDQAAFAKTFHHAFATIAGDIRIHYVVGGKGPAIILLHGNPESWREWRLVMPILVEAGFSVIAPDLRGFGDSDKPLDGYDVGTVSDDIRQLVVQLGLTSVALVGHDVGASAAYAWAAAYPDGIRKLVLIEAFPAGLEPESHKVPMWKGKPMWHPGFMSTPDLPEALLAGRERVLLDFLFREFSHERTAFSAEDIDVYARNFAATGGVRSALAHYRARPLSVALNQRLSKRRLTMPVLTIGATSSFGGSIEESARGFADDVKGVLVERSGHWVPEERPVWLARQLVNFLSGAAV